MSLSGLVYGGHIFHIVRCDRPSRSAKGRYGPAQATLGVRHYSPCVVDGYASRVGAA